MSIIFIDTETTGLPVADGNLPEYQPYIIELFALKTNKKGKVKDSWHSLFKPPIPLPDFITKITGIEEQHLAGQPTFGQKINSLANFFLGSETMVAHNLAFDKALLQFELERAGKLLQFPWPPIHFCTVEQSIYLKGFRLKLQELHKMATGEEEIKNAHRASSDVEAMLKSWLWLREQNVD